LRFLLENNLSKLGKWLRLLGHDVKVLEGCVNIKELARNQDRVFITTSNRWEKSLLRAGIRYLIVPRHDWELQLCMVLKHFRLSPELKLNLCPVCGGDLRRVDKDFLPERIPPKAYETAYDFTYCKNCDLLLWKGLHYERMKSMLTKALRRCDKI
jgi:uncharacterized protein with PIN domain